MKSFNKSWKNAVISGVFLLSSSLAFASSLKPISEYIAAPSSEDQNLSSLESMSERLARLFDEGQMPNLSEKIGANVGRCFFAHNPYVPTNAIFILRNNSNSGPLGDETFVSFIGYHPNPDPAYLDQMTYQELIGLTGNVSFDEIKESIDKRGVEVTGSGNWRAFIRANGAYLILRAFNAKGLQSSCYYYILKTPSI